MGSAPLVATGPLATAVPRFRLPEEHEPHHQRHDGPADAPQPQLVHRHRPVAVGTVFEVRLFPGVVEGAIRGAVRLASRPADSLRLQYRVPYQADVNRGGVDLQQVSDRRMMTQRADGLDAEHDPGEVQPGPDEERQQLAEVVRAGAQPGQAQAHTDVEQRLERQGRDGEQPVPGQRLARGQHDHGEHDHRHAQLLELDQHVPDGQAGARERQGPDQRQAVWHDPGRGDERPLGEVEDEDPGDEEGQEVRHTAAGVQDDAEDQVVDGGVQQWGEHLPQLAEPGLGVHRDITRGGEAHDEVAPLPELPGVDEYAGPGRARPEPVPRRQLGERLVGQGRRIYLGDHQIVGQGARTALVTCSLSHASEPMARRAGRARRNELTTFTVRRYLAGGTCRGHWGFLLGRRYRSDIWSTPVFPQSFHGAFPLVPGSLKAGQTDWGWAWR